jgi:hypothetical protein
MNSRQSLMLAGLRVMSAMRGRYLEQLCFKILALSPHAYVVQNRHYETAADRFSYHGSME